jgi:hypothetical protein
MVFSVTIAPLTHSPSCASSSSRTQKALSGFREKGHDEFTRNFRARWNTGLMASPILSPYFWRKRIVDRSHHNCVRPQQFALRPYPTPPLSLPESYFPFYLEDLCQHAHIGYDTLSTHNSNTRATISSKSCEKYSRTTFRVVRYMCSYLLTRLHRTRRFVY